MTHCVVRCGMGFIAHPGVLANHEPGLCRPPVLCLEIVVYVARGNSGLSTVFYVGPWDAAKPIRRSWVAGNCTQLRRFGRRGVRAVAAGASRGRTRLLEGRGAVPPDGRGDRDARRDRGT